MMCSADGSIACLMRTYVPRSRQKALIPDQQRPNPNTATGYSVGNPRTDMQKVLVGTRHRRHQERLCRRKPRLLLHPCNFPLPAAGKLLHDREVLGAEVPADLEVGGRVAVVQVDGDGWWMDGGMDGRADGWTGK